MDVFLTEWVSTLLRWAHVIFGIAWIGHAFLFHWLDVTLEPLKDDDPEKEDVTGDLWMVHGGGFYHVKKYKNVPVPVLDLLHWFKWEATFTWVSGFCLLVVVFYLGGGTLLIDRSVADISVATGIGISLGSMIGSWFVYDLLMKSPLGNNNRNVVPVLVVLLVVEAYFLTEYLSGRAAYLHVGAILGTIMVTNVWAVILPAHHQLIAEMKDKVAPDQKLAGQAQRRSKQNGYMHYPIIFIMVSNHFYGTYGHSLNWLILALLMVAGSMVKHVVQKKDKWMWPLLTGAAVLVVVVMAITYPRQQEAPEPATAAAAPVGKAIDAATVGRISGTVSFEGTPPERKALTLYGGCEKGVSGPVLDENVIVNDGRLVNVFVSVVKGHEGWQVPAAPTAEFEMDRIGCIYQPHVAGVRVGQKVTFINSDPIFHNVRSVAADNAVFNLIMPTKEQRITRTFRRPERMITTKCDVHPWMAAHLGVMEHPWFATSGADGTFSIEGLPPGSYDIEAWHEALGSKTATVVVPAGGSGELALSFSATP